MYQQVKTEYDALKWLKIYGYLPEVSVTDLAKDKGKSLRHSLVITQALRLAQSAFYSESQMGLPDGQFGEQTAAGMSLQRCGHPDFADEELAHNLQSKTDNVCACRAFGCNQEELDSLSSQHLSLAAVGSGSWPEPCQKAGVPVDWNTSSAPRGLDTKALFHLAAKAYWDVGCYLKIAEEGESALIRNWWVRLSGSTIGIAQFNSQRCGGSVTCRLNPNYFPNITQVAELLKHEWGHNCNLQHTRGGTMNPSILSVDDVAWDRQDPSFRTLERFFGGEPVGPNYPGNGPKPNPKPGPDVGDGYFFLDDSLYVIKLGSGSDGKINFKGKSYPMSVHKIA